MTTKPRHKPDNSTKGLYHKLKAATTIKLITANRMLFVIFFGAASTFAYFTGERLAYITAMVLFIAPAASFIITFVALRWLRVTQALPATVVKNAEDIITLRLHNPTPFPFVRLECNFFANEYAVETTPGIQLSVLAFKKAEGAIPFRIIYRGMFELGLKSIVATDYTGLFRIKRKVVARGKGHDTRHGSVLCLPQIVDFDNIPLSVSLVAEASSRFDIKDEDYSVISDVRQYIPTDSIKRVHWKLTAKRNEWLVKIFQSNAQNHLTIILDNRRVPVHEEEMYIIEDFMIESMVGMARYCLNHGMPVDFLATNGAFASALAPASFSSIYNTAAELMFEPTPMRNPESVLTQVLNDATGNVNAIIFTTQLTSELYERIVNAINRGNYAAVMYFPTEESDAESDDIYKIMLESRLPCFVVE